MSGAIEQTISKWIAELFVSAFPDYDFSSTSVNVVPTADEKFGDYQCNLAMSLAKVIKTSPVRIAGEILKLAKDRVHPAVSTIEMAGPGFINITLADKWLAERAAELLSDEARLGAPSIGGGRAVVMDYSSPNVAKPMHIGHIRSTVIGNAIDRIYRFLGYRVIADNHIGDWGTQFGVMIMGYRNFVDNKALEADPISELERVYVKSYEQARSNEEWLKQCRAELVKLQRGDPENRKLWKDFVELSLKEFEMIYQRLDIHFDLVRGESFYNEELPEVIKMLAEKNIVRESEGALVAFLEEEKLAPCIVRKSDGAFNYATTDIATVIHRAKEFQPSKIIYVTDERQQLHFQQIFAICKRLGLAVELHHIWFGLMRLPEGTFSTREGNVIKLEKLLDEAEERALKIVQELNPGIPLEKQKEIARAVGIGAVKYADLSQNPQSIVTFTWEKALAMNGNSAPYLQYAYARIRSVQDKYNDEFPGDKIYAFPIVITEKVERTLALHILRFPDALMQAARLFKPSVLADYLYSLATLYNSFYQNVPFLKAPEGIRESRVKLCILTANVLRKGLNLLGIETPERI
jgi:arginyl-tRNA synthetase